MATQIGSYQVITQLHSGPYGTLFKATAGEGAGEVAIKQFHADPALLGESQARQARLDFIERADVQRKVVLAGGRRWVQVREIVNTDNETYCILGLYPSSARRLVLQRAELTAPELLEIISGVVAGLTELKEACGRPHGNLKPENVLLGQRGTPGGIAVALSDPCATWLLGSASTAKRRDLRAVGELIHELVVHKAATGYAGPSEAWSRLGPTGEVWRSICNDLIAADADRLLAELDELKSRIHLLARGRGWLGLRPWQLAAAAGMIIAAAGIPILRGMIGHQSHARSDTSSTLPTPEHARDRAVEARQELADSIDQITFLLDQGYSPASDQATLQPVIDQYRKSQPGVPRADMDAMTHELETRLQEPRGLTQQNDFAALADVASRNTHLEVALSAWQRLNAVQWPADGDPLARIMESRQHLQAMIARISQSDRRMRLAAAVDESMPRFWQRQFENAGTVAALDDLIARSEAFHVSSEMLSAARSLRGQILRQKQADFLAQARAAQQGIKRKMRQGELEPQLSRQLVRLLDEADWQDPEDQKLVDESKKFIQGARSSGLFVSFVNELLAAPPDQRFSKFRSGAEAGNAAAMLKLGNCYARGQGAAQHWAEAMSWYRKAADIGEARAATQLGILLDAGLGSPRDEAAAAKAFRDAADRGDAQAMQRLGALYQDGRGVTQDYAQAMQCYRKAADLGDEVAMRSLGYVYFDARGVPQDLSQALKWHQQAADLGDADSMRELGAMYANGQSVAADRAAALKWYRSAADLGDEWSITHIGRMYEKGDGGKEDYVEALKWYRKGADMGDAASMDAVGLMYQNGNGVPQDQHEALRWFQKAAGKDHVPAMKHIARLCELGRGVLQDYKAALGWFRKAADAGDKEAMNELVRYYRSGLGVERDELEALKWERRAKNAQ